MGIQTESKAHCFFGLVLLMIFLTTLQPVSAETAATGKQPLDDSGAMQISESDRCPVCAMRVRNHSKFASAIQLADGTTYYFCGTGCMLRSWMHPDVFLGVEKDRIARAVTRNFFTGAPLDAAAAYWIAGSDIVGPMGPALVPIGDSDEADVFVKRHGGKTIFRLHDLNDQLWETITGKKATPSP